MSYIEHRTNMEVAREISVLQKMQMNKKLEILSSFIYQIVHICNNMVILLMFCIEMNIHKSADMIQKET